MVAVPVYLLILLVRRAGRGGSALTAAEPWVVGAALAGVALAGITGSARLGPVEDQAARLAAGAWAPSHFWLGIVLALVVVAVAAWRFKRGVRRPPHPRRSSWSRAALLALAAVLAQGYIGGRMTYDHAVGIDSGGQLAQTASGAAQLEVALARRHAGRAGRQAGVLDRRSRLRGVPRRPGPGRARPASSPAASSSRSSAASTPTACSRRRWSPTATSPRSTRT